MPGFLLLLFLLLSCGRICPMLFLALVSWNVVWLLPLGVTRFLFVRFLCVFFFWLLLFTPISATFLNRIACDKFNADAFIYSSYIFFIPQFKYMNFIYS